VVIGHFLFDSFGHADERQAMTGRHPLAVGHLTTADLIAEARLNAAPVSPAARVAAARAIARAMSPAERAEVARRNQAKLDAAAHTLNTASIALYGRRARLLIQDPE
jgi:hypothetical protein